MSIKSQILGNHSAYNTTYNKLRPLKRKKKEKKPTELLPHKKKQQHQRAAVSMETNGAGRQAVGLQRRNMHYRK